jgi:hypothetical protein
MTARIGATNNKPITARITIRISHAYCVQPPPEGRFRGTVAVRGR